MTTLRFPTVLTLVSLGMAGFAAAQSQKQFSSPEEAIQALGSAAKTKDQAALTAIFGSDRQKLLSGDPVEDARNLDRFAANFQQFAQLEKVDGARDNLVVGNDHWPLPIPIVERNGKWFFDTRAGMDEILNRRIGENELSAIMTCRAYVLAQWEYFTEALGNSRDGLAVYAQKFVSTPGKRDGLYWDVPEGGKPSPLGALVAQARAEGYPAAQPKPAHAPQHSPFHGYYFKILTRQGPHAPGGRFNYIINGNMIAGYALVAYPDKWGSSGVMTFIVSNQGRLYEKNLGARTSQVAAAMTEYDPDPTWKLVEDPK
ncbi:MAG TPA: DUF2950 domain-containing protein [Bryobacteraceae bacterium]|jgi:hypothetical protein